MKQISNSRKLNYWLNRYDIPSFFSVPDIPYELYQFEAHEYLNNEIDPFDCLLFVVSGTLRIQHVRDDGSMVQIAMIKEPVCLGDIEFASGKPSMYLIEVIRHTVCVAVPLKNIRYALRQDPVFLRYLLTELSGKIQAMTAFRTIPSSLPERVLFYLKEVSPDHEIRGIEKSAAALSCSKRQLIRILNRLCEEQKIIRLKRGHYRLSDEA